MEFEICIRGVEGHVFNEDVGWEACDGVGGLEVDDG